MYEILDMIKLFITLGNDAAPLQPIAARIRKEAA